MARQRKLGSLVVDLELGTAKFDEAWKKTQSKLRYQGRQLKAVGADLTKYVSVPLAAAGAASLKFSIDMNKGMANVATLIPGNSKRIEELKGAVQSLAIETGKSTQDLTGGLYQVVSAFGDTSESALLLELNAKAATAGLATTTDSINLLSAVTKGYGDTSLEANKQVADLAFTAVKLGQTTFPELAQSMGRVVPIAQNMKVTQEELFAVMATATGVTGKATEVSTQLRSAIKSLQAPTADMTKLLESMGVSSGQALIEQEGLHNALKMVVEAAESSGKPLQKFIADVEGQTLALTLAGSQSETYVEKLAAMSSASGTLTEAYREQTEGINSLGFALSRVQQAGVVAMQKLGDAIGDAFGADMVRLAEGFVDLLSDGIDAFRGLSPEAQKFIIVAGGVAMAVGPAALALGTLATLVGGPMLVNVGLLAGALGGLTGASVAYGDELKDLVYLIGDKFVAAWDALSDAIARAVRAKGAFFKAQAKGSLKGQMTAPGVPALPVPELKEVKFALEGIYNLMDSYSSLSFPEELYSALEGTADRANEASAAVKELEQQILDTRSSIEKSELSKALDKAIESGSLEGVKKAEAALIKHTADGIIAGYEKSGVKVTELLKSRAQELAALRVKENYDVANRYKDAMDAAHEENVAFYRGLMEDAITGQRFDLNSMFEGALADFGSEFLAILSAGEGTLGDALTGGLTKALGPLGPILEKQLGVSIKSGVEGVLGKLGLGGVGATAALGIVGGVVGGYRHAKTTYNRFTDGDISGQDQLTGLTTIAGGGSAHILNELLGGTLSQKQANSLALSVMGAPQAAAMNFLGVGGSKDVMNAALFSNPLTAPIGALNALGVGVDIDNLMDGFVSGKGFEQRVRDAVRGHLQSLGVLDENFGFQLATGGRANLGVEAFGGLKLHEGTGTALGQKAVPVVDALSQILSGGNSQIAPQLTNMLANAVSGFGPESQAAESFAEVMLNITGLMEKLGWTTEQTKGQLSEMFLDGKIGFHDFGLGIQSMNAIASESFITIGEAIDIAAKNMGEGGNLRTALKGIELAFKKAEQEGTDAFATVLSVVEEKFGPEVAAQFAALKDKGVDSFEDFANLSADQLHALFGALQGFSEDGAATLQGSLDTVTSISDVLTGMPTDLEVNIKINQRVTTEGDPIIGSALGNVFSPKGLEKVRAFAKGGVVHSPTLFNYKGGIGIMGEDGSEAIMPLTRDGAGKLVGDGRKLRGGDVHYHVNAPNATPGMVPIIIEAVKAAHRQSVRDSAKMIANAKRSGRV